ncbi:hypothetical protein ACIBCA_09750 [Kitasatospora sp. NPDC051170]|uniref:hypothetical protein n=1 Tax=Kitasatospora sp. NPDC051170 TaxID=3364056 RepID=UPI0037A9A965
MAVFIVIVLLLAGVGLVLMGYEKLHTAVPTCFGKPMEPGQICYARDPGPPGDGMPAPQNSTYAEQLDSLTSGGWTAVVIGVVLIVIALLVAASVAASE